MVLSLYSGLSCLSMLLFWLFEQFRFADLSRMLWPENAKLVLVPLKAHVCFVADGDDEKEDEEDDGDGDDDDYDYDAKWNMRKRNGAAWCNGGSGQ